MADSVLVDRALIIISCVLYFFVANLKKRMMDPVVRAQVLANTSEKYRIDEAKRPADNIPKESFRRLNID